MSYIKPRKKEKGETKDGSLCRRLEEYIEYAHARNAFADVVFYEELLKRIESNNNFRASPHYRERIICGHARRQGKTASIQGL